MEALREFKATTLGLDLSEAYRKAGTLFEDRLEHCFVVLKDDKGKPTPRARATGGNKTALGVKRKPSQDAQSGSSKRPLF